jgi:benzoyl-CoA reductase/2-hydroxyglutaryl-CoA dehydratase subunit BcrC/BadD/HgdB
VSEATKVTDGSLEDECFFCSRYPVDFRLKETEHLKKETQQNLIKLKYAHLKRLRAVKNRAKTMEYFDSVMYTHDQRIKELMALKKQGFKVIGTFCIMIPEEIMFAANAIPVRLCGGFYDAIYPAEEVLPKNICPAVKSALGTYILDLNPFYKLCDAVIVPTTCDAKKKLASVIANFMPVMVMDVPNTRESIQASEYWYGQTRLLVKKLEQLTGKGLSRRNLERAIKRQNERTSALRRLLELRKAPLQVVNERDFLLVVQSAQYDDVDRWLQKTNELCAELENNLKNKVGIAPQDAPRILLTGSPVLWPNFKVLNIMEDLGAVCVADDSCSGTQYLYNPVEVSDWSKNSMIRAVAERAILPCICPCFTHGDDRIDRILELYDTFKAEGIIYHVLRLCQIFDMEFLPVDKVVNDKGIPLLKIETEYSEEDTGQIKTRVEAFIEMIKTRRPRR